MRHSRCHIFVHFELGYLVSCNMLRRHGVGVKLAGRVQVSCFGDPLGGDLELKSRALVKKSTPSKHCPTKPIELLLILSRQFPKNMEDAAALTSALATVQDGRQLQLRVVTTVLGWVGSSHVHFSCAFFFLMHCALDLPLQR